MKRRMWLAAVLLALFWTTPAMADNRFIVRSSLTSGVLEQFCILQGCTVAGALDGTLNQGFFLTTPSTINATKFLNVLQNTPGILAAQRAKLINLVSGLNTT